MQVRGWPCPNTVIRTGRPIWFEKSVHSGAYLRNIVPPVPSGATESADDPFVITVGPVRIAVTRADIEYAR